MEQEVGEEVVNWGRRRKANEVECKRHANMHQHMDWEHMVMIFVPALLSYQVATSADAE